MGGTKVQLDVLVLGTGFFGRQWLQQISKHPECRVAGIVSQHPDLLAAVGEEFAIPAQRRYAAIDPALAQSGAQAVVVALPEMVHKTAILAALEHGLHVLTEKPLAMTMAEATEIIRAARRVPEAVVMVDQNYRWRPQTQTLRGAIREGRIGQIVSVGYAFRQAITRTTTDAWREQMRHPFLHDMAPHHFDLLRACTGLECRLVTAVGVRPPWSWYAGVPGVDAIFTFERSVSVSYSGTMAGRGLETPQEGIVTFMGEGGVLRLEADSQVRWYGEKGVGETIPPTKMTVTDTAYTLQEFLAAIEEGRKPETHLEDNVQTLAIIEAAITSVDSGTPVEVLPLVAAALRG
jgi:predicted dehydrogenase